MTTSNVLFLRGSNTQLRDVTAGPFTAGPLSDVTPLQCTADPTPEHHVRTSSRGPSHSFLVVTSIATIGTFEATRFFTIFLGLPETLQQCKELEDPKDALISPFYVIVTLLYFILNHHVIRCHYRAFFTSSSSKPSACLSSFQLLSSLCSCHIITVHYNVSSSISSCPFSNLHESGDRVTNTDHSAGKYLWTQIKHVLIGILLRFSMPVRNQYFCKDEIHGLVTSEIRRKIQNLC